MQRRKEMANKSFSEGQQMAVSHHRNTLIPARKIINGHVLILETHWWITDFCQGPQPIILLLQLLNCNYHMSRDAIANGIQIIFQYVM